MYKMFKHDVESKVIEHVVATSREEVAQVMMQYFCFGWTCHPEEIVEVTPEDVESDGQIISWEEYQRRFKGGCYWGYYDPQENKWYRVYHEGLKETDPLTYEKYHRDWA